MISQRQEAPLSLRELLQLEPEERSRRLEDSAKKAQERFQREKEPYENWETGTGLPKNFFLRHQEE